MTLYVNWQKKYYDFIKIVFYFGISNEFFDTIFLTNNNFFIDTHINVLKKI